MIELLDKLNNYKVILASQSPRRKELLKGLDFNFETKVIPNIDEIYPKGMPGEKVPEFLAIKKCEAYQELLKDSKNILITADTIVILNNEILEKPNSIDDAKNMIHKLSGNKHTVITGVCLGNLDRRHSFSDKSEVQFSSLSNYEIDYYVDKYMPMDKAGAYGVQEWIGYAGIKSINGSYFNIMGLPVQMLYKELNNFLD